MAANTPIKDPADVLNVALRRMGYKKSVGNLFDGSEASQSALDVYGQTRDQLLRNADYDFSLRTVVLTQLKAAPSGGYFPPTAWNPANNPAMGYSYEYAFPDDALKIRIVKPAQLFRVNADPQFHRFRIGNDNAFSPARRVILSNVPSAVASYTAQVTDLTTWDVAAVEALAAALARRLAPVLMDLNAEKLEIADEQSTAAASMAEGR